MNGDQGKAKTIFLRAAEIAAADERQAYLAAACGGDHALRSEVEDLLRHQERLGSFLEAAPGGPATAAEPIQEAPGTVIGPYKLLQQIGEGGMGTVFMAEQIQPVQRKVALKLIKAGMDSRQVIVRFEAERQALAMMDHVNIARVLDAGATEAGRPYFVMELVHGIPITKYCDDNHLTPRERLELFVPVCQAIQHAHQKGIIHRDIKPSNVMVTLYDGKPVPKVIDFGVAKAIEQRLTERTLFTQYGTLVGTLEYMSPEQAEMSALGVDTRSDIFSLGVLLYELLTGSTPLSHKRLKEAAYAEVLRMIKEEEPPRPSTRLSDSGEALASISAQRHMEPAKLTRLVRGELDWIVMKTLEKDRNRRYETANGLAMDVQRYLTDEPVQACPPSTGYRLRKFVKRNRGPVLAATVVLLVLVAGIVGTTLGLVKAWHQRDLTEQARKDEAEQRWEAVTNAEKAKEEEGKARAAGGEARLLATEEKAARDRAEKQLLRAEWLLYASQINLAQQAWESRNAVLASHYLDSCRRDFRGWEHDYLFTLFNSNQHTFRGHTKGVSSVALSPDGKRIVSGSDDQTVKVWDAATGQEVLSLKGHTGPVFSVAVSPDGKRIVSGSADQTVKVWDAATGQETLTLKGHTREVVSVAVSPDGKRIVSGSADQTVKVWDAATGQETLTLKGDTGIVLSVAVSPDGKRIVSGSVHVHNPQQPVLSHTVKVWDAATGQETRSLKGHTDMVYSVAVSPDGKRIVSGSADQTVKVWDAATGQEVLRLKEHTGPVNSVAVSPDGKRIVSGSDDYTVKVWDAATGQETRTLIGHTDVVSSVVLSPSGKLIVSASHDKTVKVWDQETLTLKQHRNAVRSVAVSPDGKRIVSGSFDQTVKVWDAVTRREVLSLKGHTGGVSSVALSPDGKRIVSGSDDYTVKVWDAATGQETLTLKGHTGPVFSVAVSPDGKRIVSGSADQTVKVWDAATGQETLTLKGHTDMVNSVALSPDGKRIVSGSDDQTVKVWDAATGQETLTLKGHTGPVVSVALSPDGKRIVSGSFDQTVKVWDAATGQEALTLKGHTGSVFSVAVSPDGKRIVSGSRDHTVKVWDAATGQETLSLKGHTDMVNSVALSPDGKRVVSGSWDQTVKVWDASMSAPPREVELAK